ncbi:hypothetical protein [Nonomuraea typhae]|uniref:hypothetical protein n=1 Tax=Nonomuraea typhae TaxID=2603600 RepID=UPI0012FAE4F2|nr:hypothetical protein [Nonomuraea typhae]
MGNATKPPAITALTAAAASAIVGQAATRRRRGRCPASWRGRPPSRRGQCGRQFAYGHPRRDLIGHPLVMTFGGGGRPRSGQCPVSTQLGPPVPADGVGGDAVRPGP